jgi:predicted nucleic acid-binding protein
LRDADESRLFISVVTLAEIRRGIELLAPGLRRRRLDIWLSENVIPRFENRALPVDNAVADVWGRVMSRGQAAGRTPPTLDTFIAATAILHDLTLVTRNVTDFGSLGLRVINPWQET